MRSQVEMSRVVLVVDDDTSVLEVVAGIHRNNQFSYRNHLPLFHVADGRLRGGYWRRIP